MAIDFDVKFEENNKSFNADFGEVQAVQGESDHSKLSNLDYENSGHTGFAAASDIPTKISQLTNDSGFITSAPVISVNNKTGAVSLNAEDVGALSNTTIIPSKTSQLTNDSGYITGYTESDPVYTADKHKIALKSEIPSKTSDLTNDSGFITNYTESDPIYTADKPNIALKSEIPTVPTKVSAFTNDAGYLTEHQSLEGYATDEELAAKQDKLTAGNNITIVNNVISASGGGSYELPMASASTLGGIKVGTGLSIDTNGVLSLALTNANGVSF